MFCVVCTTAKIQNSAYLFSKRVYATFEKWYILIFESSKV